jgi:hypothetical protein
MDGRLGVAVSGYSGTQLVKKLTLRDGMRVWFDAMPEHVIDEIDEYALELLFVADPAEGIDAAHIFVTERAVLEQHLAALRNQISPEGQIWVSWPKKAAKLPTDITEDARSACRSGWSIPRCAQSTRPGRASNW